MSSAVLRRGASVLLHVLRADGRGMRFARLVDGALAQFESGEEDLDALLREGEPWTPGGVSRSEARESLRGALGLLDVGGSCELELEVTSRSGLTFDGKLCGESVQIELERRDARSAWGVYSPFAVVSGPSALLGTRVVEVDSDDDSDSPADDPFSGIGPGDKLYLADPDRAAVKDILLYDHLPEMSRWVAPLMEVVSKVESDEAEGVVATVDGKVLALKDLFFEDEIIEAVRFCLLTEQLDSEEKRVHARMERLSNCPAVQELQKLIVADSDWRELAEALEPKSQALYGAARATLLRRRSLDEDEDRVTIVSVDAERAKAALAAGALAVVVAVAALVMKLGEARDTTGAQGPLPLYSLQSEAAPRVMPLLYGTPLMPSQ